MQICFLFSMAFKKIKNNTLYDVCKLLFSKICIFINKHTICSCVLRI